MGDDDRLRQQKAFVRIPCAYMHCVKSTLAYNVRVQRAESIHISFLVRHRPLNVGNAQMELLAQT